MQFESTINFVSVSPGGMVTRTTSKITDYHGTEGERKSFDRRSGAGWRVHPGEILKNEFLVPLEISGYRLAQALGVNPQSINDIVLEKRGISADMAVRLGRFFQTSPEFWLNLQSAYDLARATKALKKKLNKIQPFAKAAAT